MNIDMELASWKQEWREQTEHLPDVRKKIKRQDRRTMTAIVLACVCMVLSAIAAWRVHTAFFYGLAAGLWSSCLIMGVYAWRVRRGTWKPAAQTTAAYIELWHRRAVARERIARFAFRFLLIALVLYAGFAAWNWKSLSPLSGVILAAIAVELFWLRHIAQKRRQEIETTEKLLQSSRESVEVPVSERQV
jgi:high-affinity Fe2+/Pb2+ permease